MFNFLKKSQMNSFYYIGDCRSTVDVSEIWDATEMAQMVEDDDAVSFDINILLPLTDGIKTDLRENLKNAILKYPERFECMINGDIAWIYDEETDIHYFFERD